MLAIKTQQNSWVSWWLGYPVPPAAQERVVTFQADGDELALILAAMEATSGLVGQDEITYTKERGFVRVPRNLNE